MSKENKQLSKSFYGLKIGGKIRVFSKTKEIQGKNKKKYTITDYWFNVSEKNDDNTYFNRSMNLIFSKDADKPLNNSVVIIHEANFMITGEGDYRKISMYVKSWSEPVEDEPTNDFVPAPDEAPFK